MPEPLARAWHVVATEPMREQRVAERLAAASFSVFNPSVFARVKVNAARTRWVKRAMLPGYLFAGFDAARDPWHLIVADRPGRPGIPGVLRVLKYAERPVPIAETVIEHLRERELAANGRKPRLPPIAIKRSAIVRIIEPLCFAGLFGLVVDVLERARLVDVEIDIFGRAVPMRLKPDQVEPV